MNSNIDINKPTPLAIDENIISYNRRMDVEPIIKALNGGKQVRIDELYNDGIFLLKEINRHLKSKLSNKSFHEQQEYRAEYQRLSNLVLVEIVGQKLNVKKAPEIGWLEKFYTDNNQFLLTFPQVQGLNSSWQWYENGISIPVLRNKLHPFYGTYFPTRFEHLILFDNWLKRYQGPKKTAIDVGVGCGVLSLQMVQHGFQKVFGTDVNPNAIAGLIDFMGETKLSRKIELDFAPFFGKWEKPTELIVFNPPWLPASDFVKGMDQAIYYDENLFPNFFEAAKKRLLPDGKIVLLFSNIAQITQVTKEHPIEKEIAEGGRFKLERVFKKSVGAASEKTKRDPHWRSDEEVELWELTHI